jgi:hypothetical protein
MINKAKVQPISLPGFVFAGELNKGDVNDKIRDVHFGA